MAGDAGGRFQNKVLAGVLAVVENQRRQVVFVKQKSGPYAGHWLLPGGGMEPGETAEAAVVREVLEETGIKVSAPEFLGVYELRGEWAEGPYHLLMLAFMARTYQDVPAQFQGDNVDGAAFFDPQKMPMSLHATDMQILTDAGLAVVSRSTIHRELEKGGIQLTRYGIRPQPPLTDEESAARRLRG